jgi:dTMP kinase
MDASYAYQGYGRGIDLGIIENLNRLVTKGIRPNLTVILDCSVSEGFRRKTANGFSMDRFEKEEAAFHRKIKRSYLKLSKEDPKRFFVVDGKKQVDDIQMLIRQKVEQLLKSHGI